MRQILCVIDFTESSGKVLEVGARIATACGAHLLVLYPFRLIDYGHRGDISSLKVRLETEAREKFELLKKSLSSLETLSCEFQSEIGFMGDRISAHVRKNNIDMVIIGQHLTDPSNDIKSFNLQRLITNSQLPFVIVPAEVNAEANVQKV